MHRWVALPAIAVLMITGNVWCQYKAMSTEELTSRASVVVVAKVSATRSEWSADRSRILTRVSLAVEQYLKGDQAGQTLTLVIPGGEIDGVGELYTHVTRFKPDEEVIVFAERDARGGLRVVGGEQGKFTVVEDRASGRKTVGEDQALEVVVEKIKNVVRANQK